MLIDPTQPIYFDSDSAPGRGMGWWQMKPRLFMDDGGDDIETSPTPDTLAGRFASRLVFAVVLGGIPLAALHMMLT
jgi:hypothetical protein